MSTTLPLQLLRTDDYIQPRCQMDETLIAAYEADLRAGAQFPPVEVFYDGADHWVADGFHRIEAARKVGHATIEANIHKGSRRDAILYSVGANAQHGLRRTNADKRHVIVKLLQDDEWSQWSDRAIARHCGVDDKTVAHCREQLSAEIPQMRARMVTRQGVTYPMNIDRRPKLPADAPDFLQDWIDRGDIGIRDAIHLHAALGGAPAPVVELVARWGVTDHHSIPTILRMYKNGTGPDSTFDEVLHSGMIQPGDEEEAVPITMGQHALEQAMARKHQLHRQLGAQEKETRLRHSLQEPPDLVYNVLFLNLATLQNATETHIPGLPASMRHLLPSNLTRDAALFLCIPNALLSDGVAVAESWGFTYRRYLALIQLPRRQIPAPQKYACDTLLLHFTRGEFPPVEWIDSTIPQPQNMTDDQLSRSINAKIKSAYPEGNLLVIPTKRR